MLRGRIMSRGKKSPDAVRQALPDQPDLALFVATVFQRLGGRFEIDEQGRRHTMRPSWLSLREQPLPQLAQAMPDERFHSPEEWHGAMKLLEYWLERLSEADRERVFTALATVDISRTEGFDFRELL